MNKTKGGINPDGSINEIYALRAIFFAFFKHHHQNVNQKQKKYDVVTCQKLELS